MGERNESRQRSGEKRLSHWGALRTVVLGSALLLVMIVTGCGR